MAAKRDAFERFAKHKGWIFHFNVAESVYYPHAVQTAWEAWQEASTPTTVCSIVGDIFFHYWDRLADPTPEDSVEKITGELLQRLNREAVPLMLAPGEKLHDGP